MEFNAEEFLGEIYGRNLISLGLDVKYAMRKQEVKNILIDRLVDDEKLEIKKEMELAKLQMEQTLKQQ